MKNYCSVISKCLVVFVCAGLTYAVNVQAAAPVVNTADCTAPIITQPNVLTRAVSLQWSKVMNATGFSLQILPLGGTCGVTAPIREIKDIVGTPSSYTLPTDIVCGMVKVCVKANCCNDRCDACELDPNKDYCSDMADKYTGICGCRDHGGQPGTFKFKYAGDKVIGCSWQCADGVVGNNNKTCGTDYEVRCGKPAYGALDYPPHNTIVGNKPYYGLCSVFDSVKITNNGDDYLVKPAEVSTSGTVLYTWNCLGAKPPLGVTSSCFACRRATCAVDFQGKSFTERPDEKKLCLDDGVITADPKKINLHLSPDGKKWLWDCIGEESCGDPKLNRNWADGVMQDHCSAEANLCGWGDKQKVTYGTLNNNSNGVNIETYKAFGVGQGKELGDFWCSNGGKVQQPLRNGNQPVPMPIHTKAGTVDSLKWRCVYEGDAASVSCEANLISCNPEITAKNAVDDKFNTFRDDRNLCLNGDGAKFLADGVVDGPTTLNNKFNWNCQDKFFGLAGYNSAATTCSANEVACKTPPAGNFYTKKEEIKLPICANGLTSLIRDHLNSMKILDYWAWDCRDDFGSVPVNCQAKRLTCANPPMGHSYRTWQEFILANQSCTDFDPAHNTIMCPGFCTDGKSTKVTLNPDTKQWNWTCGVDPCVAVLGDDSCGDANKIKMVKGYFDKQAALKGTSFLCKNGSPATPAVPKHEAGVGWTWTCGIENTACYATEVSCGKLASTTYTEANWLKKNKADLCVNPATVSKIGDWTRPLDQIGDVEAVTTGQNAEFPKGIEVGRKWSCNGQFAAMNGEADDSLICTNNLVDCGTADANKFLDANKAVVNGVNTDFSNNRLRPKTSDGTYHGSFAYNEGVPDAVSNLACIGTKSYSNYDADGNRGVFTWNCAGDDDGQIGDSVVSCVARKDCGWAGPEESGYATVYFSQNTPRSNGQAAGCWTAESIKNIDNSSLIEMPWYQAVGRTLNQFQTNGYDGFNHVADGKISDTAPEQGICPSGWEVPSNLAWHHLEDSLDDAGLCQEKRLSTTDYNVIFQCNLASKAYSSLGYGLLSRITFSGANGIENSDSRAPASYWTKTSVCSSGNYNLSTEGKNIDYCPVVAPNQIVKCAGKTLPVGTRYAKLAPFIFDVNDDNDGHHDTAMVDKVGRGAFGADDCFVDHPEENKQQLRCVKSSCDDWQKFYQEVFGLSVDFSQVKIPAVDKNQSSLKFLQCMPQGLTYTQMHDAEKQFYVAHGYGIMDWDNNWPNLINLNTEERKTTKAYAILHSGLAEPENTYAGKSADFIAQQVPKIKTMTRLERGVYGLYYYWKNGVNIDQQKLTYCTGSRQTNGGVPYVNWFGIKVPDKLSSNWLSSAGTLKDLNPRPVIAF